MINVELARFGTQKGTLAPSSAQKSSHAKELWLNVTAKMHQRSEQHDTVKLSNREQNRSNVVRNAGRGGGRLKVRASLAAILFCSAPNPHHL